MNETIPAAAEPTPTPPEKKIRVDALALQRASHYISFLHSFTLEIIRSAYSATGATCEVSEQSFRNFVMQIDMGKLSMDTRTALFQAIGKLSR